MEFQREYLRDARRKAQQRRDYFDEEDEEEHVDNIEQKYQLSSTSDASSTSKDQADGEIDPLDAFMEGIDAQVEQEKQIPSKIQAKPEILRQEDHNDEYIKDYVKNKRKKGERMEFQDSDEEVYATAKQFEDGNDEDSMREANKTMEVLAPLEHSKITYEPFRRDFYTPHKDVLAMSDEQVAAFRKELSVRTQGTNVPNPVQSFIQVGFDRKMLGMLMKLGMEAPTSIQCQAFPVALSGRDMIGIAKTGSGKTLAFTLPMVVHIMDQRELEKDEGPIALVLSPTRELAHQIFVEVKRFLKHYGAECAAIYGGVNKWEQIQALKKGAEAVIATPGRLIEMIRKKAAKMNRVTYVVLDEADRMFEMGFEPQLRSIMGQIRPDRQTLLFSATFRRRIEALALDILSDPVKVTVGQIGQANEDIHQIAVVLPADNAKWSWLMSNLNQLVTQGRLLIFAASKIGCEELSKSLNATGFESVCLHGDKNQQERSESLLKFKNGAVKILVATDVAARGLDIKEIKNVVNYDVAKNIDTHVHRIGRTGRMGLDGFEPGTAYTLVTMKESQFASQLVYNMDVSGQQVPPELVALAKRDPKFRRGVRHSKGSGGHTKSETHERELNDEEELTRWHESRRMNKSNKKTGLGFGNIASTAGRSSRHSEGSKGLQSFVKASSVTETTAASIPNGRAVSEISQKKDVLHPSPRATSMYSTSSLSEKTTESDLLRVRSPEKTKTSPPQGLEPSSVSTQQPAVAVEAQFNTNRLSNQPKRRSYSRRRSSSRSFSRSPSSRSSSRSSSRGSTRERRRRRSRSRSSHRIRHYSRSRSRDRRRDRSRSRNRRRRHYSSSSSRSRSRSRSRQPSSHRPSRR